MSAASLRAPSSWLKIHERHGRKLPRIAEIGLVILLAHAAAILAWKLVPVPAAAAWRAPAAAPAAPGEGPRGPNVEQIANAHLFGQYQAPVEPALTAIDEAPDTRLDLNLLGILAATAERGSRALIASSAGDEKPFGVGDDVVRGASIQAIFPDRVILTRSGQLETLRLDKDAVGKLPRSLGQGFRPAAEDGGDEEGLEPGGDPDSGAVLSDIRQELLADPSRASDYIRVQPAANGGQLRGYRIYPGRDRTVFTAAGLRPGDLVTQVNGIQLNDASTALQMLGQLSQANSLTVIVERGGQQQTINVNFN